MTEMCHHDVKNVWQSRKLVDCHAQSFRNTMHGQPITNYATLLSIWHWMCTQKARLNWWPVCFVHSVVGRHFNCQQAKYVDFWSKAMQKYNSTLKHSTRHQYRINAEARGNYLPEPPYLHETKTYDSQPLVNTTCWQLFRPDINTAHFYFLLQKLSNYLTTDGLKKFSLLLEARLRPVAFATCKVKVKFSHTRYRALGPELIPVYKQSARRWHEVNHAIYPAVVCHCFLPGLRLPS